MNKPLPTYLVFAYVAFFALSATLINQYFFTGGMNSASPTSFFSLSFSGSCGNGIWETGETLANCPADCTEYCNSPPDEINVLDTGDYIVGSYIMPGWYVGGNPPIGQLMTPVRVKDIWTDITNNQPYVSGADQPLEPLVNPYDDSNPVSMDWTIKWGLENGVSLFVYDWFWYKGTNWFDNSKSLEQAFLQSKYLDKYPVKFAVMWTNVYDATYPGAMVEDRTKMIKYAIDNYFKHPNYLKIDGKPVFYIFRSDNIPASKYVRVAAKTVGKYGPQITNRIYVTDGDTNVNYSSIDKTQGNCIELNLGKEFVVDEIKIWHKKNRTYQNPVVTVSKDKVNWTTLNNGTEYLETNEGKTYILDSETIRYVKECIDGSDADSKNFWAEIEVWGYFSDRYINLAKDLAEKEQVELAHTLNTFEEIAVQEGLGGIYFVNVDNGFSWQEPEAAIAMGMDALTAYYYSPTSQTSSNGVRYATYNELVSQYEDNWAENYNIDNDYFPLITPGYDDTMKAEEGGKLITNPTPDKFGILARKAKSFVDQKNINPKIIMVKAWNEWPESSVLAPTKKWGFGYLNAIKKEFGIATEEGPKPNKVFILAGQSNMVGAGAANSSGLYVEPNPNVLEFSDNSNNPAWSPQSVPIGVKFGPELMFGRTMSGLLEEPVGIIKVAQGGTSIYDEWDLQNGYLFQKLKNYIEIAKKDGVEFVGMAWMQGESDCRDETSAGNYKEKLESLIQEVRNLTGNQNLRFIAGRINPPDSYTNYQYADTVRNAITNVTLSDYDWVDCDDLTKTSDNIHYDTSGQLELGKRFAEKMNEVSVPACDNDGICDTGETFENCSADCAMLVGTENCMGADFYVSAVYIQPHAWNHVFWTNLDLELAEEDFKKIKAAGYDAVTLDASWGDMISEVDLATGNFSGNWSSLAKLSSLVDLAKENSLKVIVIIDADRIPKGIAGKTNDLIAWGGNDDLGDYSNRRAFINYHEFIANKLKDKDNLAFYWLDHEIYNLKKAAYTREANIIAWTDFLIGKNSNVAYWNTRWGSSYSALENIPLPEYGDYSSNKGKDFEEFKFEVIRKPILEQASQKMKAKDSDTCIYYEPPGYGWGLPGYVRNAELDLLKALPYIDFVAASGYWKNETNFNNKLPYNEYSKSRSGKPITVSEGGLKQNVTGLNETQKAEKYIDIITTFKNNGYAGFNHWIWKEAHNEGAVNGFLKVNGSGREALFSFMDLMKNYGKDVVECAAFNHLKDGSFENQSGWSFANGSSPLIENLALSKNGSYHAKINSGKSLWQTVTLDSLETQLLTVFARSENQQTGIELNIVWKSQEWEEIGRCSKSFDLTSGYKKYQMACTPPQGTKKVTISAKGTNIYYALIDDLDLVCGSINDEPEIICNNDGTCDSEETVDNCPSDCHSCECTTGLCCDGCNFEPVGTACAQTSCPENYCQGNTPFTYPTTCTKTCNNSGNCVSCSCTVTQSTVCDISDYCSSGACLTCPNGFANCDSNPSNGCEVGLNVNNSNCGTCGNECGTGKQCQSGICVTIDPCAGITCGADAQCSGGSCSCSNGYANCDGLWSNGCETNLESDNGSCGSCNNVCFIGQQCQNGSCVTTNPCAGKQDLASCGTNKFCCAQSCQNTPSNCTECKNENYRCSSSQLVCGNEPYGTTCSDDGIPCTSNICNRLGSCSHPLSPIGTTCSQANTCNGNNLCTLISCNALGQCTGLKDCSSCDTVQCPSGAVGSCEKTCSGNACQTCMPNCIETNCSDNIDNDNDGLTDSSDPNCNECNGKSAGTSCSDDGLDCTSDACDGQGSCAHEVLQAKCLIDGICYNNGDSKSDNSCLKCSGETGWSNAANETSCNDDDACTTNDSCNNGTCSGSTVNCGSNAECSNAICACDYGFVDCDNDTENGCEASILSGCPSCANEETRTCLTSDSCSGTQECANGEWNGCVKNSITCTANETISCTPKFSDVSCNDLSGTKTCDTCGTAWNQCIPENNETCCPGTTRNCDTPMGCGGSQTCSSQGQWEECVIESQTCSQNETETCVPQVGGIACDAFVGNRLCNACGTGWSECFGPQNIECCPGQTENCFIEGCEGTKTCLGSGLWNSCTKNNASCGTEPEPIIEPTPTPIQETCSSNKDCANSEQCSGKDCVTLNCGECQITGIHECVSKNDGICCSEKWNQGFDSCDLDFESADRLLEEIYDEYAEELIEEARRSHETGNLKRAKAGLTLAKAKLEIEKAANDGFDTTEVMVVFLLAKKSFEEGELELAIQEAERAIAIIHPSPWVNIPLPLLISGGFLGAMTLLMVLGTGFGKVMQFKAKKREEEIKRIKNELKQKLNKK